MRKQALKLQQFFASRPTTTYWLYLGVAFVIAFAIRVPAILQEVPPYLFCDEGIFYSDVLRMLHTGSWESLEFRSGPMNVYPVLILARFIEIFRPLTDLQVLLLGRAILPLTLGALAILPAAHMVTVLSGRRFWGGIAAATFLSSEMLLSISRYWYPDHYIVFIASVVALLGALILKRAKHAQLWLILLGISLGIAVSTKYTLAALAIPSLLALVPYRSELIAAKRRTFGRLRPFLPALAAFSIAVLTTLVLHSNTILHPDEFGLAQEYNSKNYGGIAANPLDGIFAYGFVTFVLLLGLPGIAGIAVGGISLLRQKRFRTLAYLVSAPLVIVIVMGAQNLFINRNTVFATPFLIALCSIGIGKIVDFALTKTLATRVMICSILGLLFAAQFALVAKSFIEDLQPDPRITAQTWIADNLDPGTQIGTNAFCSGMSPAEVAGMATTDDPNMEKGFDYYLFDSYWASAIESNFRGHNANVALFDQKLLHYYFLNNKAIASDLLNPAPRDSLYVPDGFSLIQRIQSNGHEVWLLKRD